MSGMKQVVIIVWFLLVLIRNSKCVDLNDVICENQLEYFQNSLKTHEDWAMQSEHYIFFVFFF